MSVIRRGVPVVAVAVAMLATQPAGAQAEDVKYACLVAHERGQIARISSKFADARASLRSCAQESCPGLVRADCVQWLAELEAVYPSVVFDAYVDGRQALGARVYVDGALAAERIDGKAVPMDPGRHVFRIEVPGFPPNNQVLVLPEGVHERIVSASFAHPGVEAPAPRPPRPRPVPKTVWIAGGTAAAAAVLLAVFGELALSEKTRLETTCLPFCSDSQLSTLHTYMGGADISLGVAAAAVVAGGILYLLRPEVEPPPQPSLSVAPTAGGALLSLAGRF